jgi:3-dehydroquinate synthase
VKHAILVGAPFFGQLEACLGSLRANDLKTLGPVLESAVAAKVKVVSRDEREAHLRQVLNLGHTVGHALEEATRYRRFLHGEAVGWGLLAATRLAWRVGLFHGLLKGGREATRIMRLVRDVGPLPPIRDIAPEKILKLLPRDKKTIGGRIHWVLPERIGKVRIVADVPSRVVAAAFRDVQEAADSWPSGVEGEI